MVFILYKRLLYISPLTLSLNQLITENFLQFYIFKKQKQNKKCNYFIFIPDFFFFFTFCQVLVISGYNFVPKI